jgi:ABC-2 type transport system ATP-binding protein
MEQTPDIVAEFSGVTKNYGHVRAVDGIDLSIERGKTIALLGPNGSGKSTTIDMLLGLLPVDSGKITVFGRSPVAAVRAGLVGAMRQAGSFPASARVAEVIAFARDLYPKPAAMDDLVEWADLGALLDRRTDRLSGGQSQRVRFAFAAAGNPDLLVLDEPTVGMDVEARTRFWQSINTLAQTGRTVLFSTHYLEEADGAADEIVLLAKGRVLVHGTGAQIKHMVGGKTISFQLDGASPDGLDLLPAVSGVEVRHNRAYLQTTDSDATISALLSSRGPVKDLELTGGSLDQAFLALTSGGATGNGDK